MLEWWSRSRTSHSLDKMRPETNFVDWMRVDVSAKFTLIRVKTEAESAAAWSQKKTCSHALSQTSRMLLQGSREQIFAEK